LECFCYNAVAARPEWSSFVVFVTGKALEKLQKAGTEGGKAAQNNKNINRVYVIYKKDRNRNAL
jgi:hypothetical protein